VTQNVPVGLLPVRNAVLLPGATPTYDVGRERSVALVRSVRLGDVIAVFVQKDGATDEVAEEDLHRVGTLARVTSIAKAGAGYALGLEGVSRTRLVRVTKTEPHLEAELADVVEENADATDTGKLARTLHAEAEEAFPGTEIDGSDPSRLADRVGELLDISLQTKVAILAETDVKKRIALVLDRLSGPKAGEEDDEDAAWKRKERVLHTRVPAVLERELKRLAENLRVPVSNLVRAVLEDAVSVADKAGENVESRLKNFAQGLGSERERIKKRVQRDPLGDVFAFQAVKLAMPAACAKCDKEMKRGESANLGLTDEPRKGSERVFVCDACLPDE
jgi:ATP-dependent Lon protease